MIRITKICTDSNVDYYRKEYGDGSNRVEYWAEVYANDDMMTIALTKEEFEEQIELFEEDLS